VLLRENFLNIVLMSSIYHISSKEMTTAKIPEE